MPAQKTLCIDLRWIDASGVGTYIRGIMPGIVRMLDDISIIAVGDRSRLDEFPWSRASNVQLIDCRAERYSLTEQVQLPLVIPSRTDLFFSPYYTIPLLYRGRLAVTVHDMSHLIVQEIRSDAKKRTYAQIMFCVLRKRSSVIFTVSNFSRLELLRLTQGPRSDNIIPTHLGVSSEWYRAPDLPTSRRRPYFVCVGNVKPYKNLGRLLEAFISIRDEVEHDLVIIGQSEGLITGESATFFKRVRDAGERVQLTGFISHQELVSLVAHAHALVLPSLYEGFGLPPIEAMAAGVPAVVSRVASLPEVCGDAALYFDPLRVEDIAEKLLLIASDELLHRQLREKGLQRSRLYTWEACSEKTVQGLRAALDGGSPR